MESVFLEVLNMSITASVLILVVLLMRLLLRKAPKWVMCLLWGIVAIRLLCPFSIESVLSLLPSARPVPQDIALMQTPAINTGIPAINQVVNPIIIETFSPEPVASANPLQLVTFVVAYVWLIGVVVLGLYAVISFFLLYKKVKSAIKADDNIKLCDYIETPFILGILRPCIYIPSGISTDQFSHVLAHEKAHLKRFDHLWKPLGFLALAIHWFNPLVWIAYVLLCKDIEIACDEKVISDLDKNNVVSYSQSLLECSVGRRNILMCPLAFGEVSVKERIKHVINYKKPSFWIIITTVLACIIIAVCFLTNPKESNDNTQISTEYSPDDIADNDIDNQSNSNLYVDEIAKYLSTLSDDALELSNEGCFIITYNANYGMKHFIKFMNSYSSKQPAHLVIGQYTTEGDIVFYYLQYDGNEIMLVIDSRRDKFAGNGDHISIYHYKSIECDEITEENGDIKETVLLKDGIDIPPSDNSNELEKEFFVCSFCNGNIHAQINKDLAHHDLATVFDESTVLKVRNSISYLIITNTITGEVKEYSILDGKKGFNEIMDAIYNLDIAPDNDSYRGGKLYMIQLCDKDKSICQTIVPYQDATIIDYQLYDGTGNGTSNQLLITVDEVFNNSLLLTAD